MILISLDNNHSGKDHNQNRLYCCYTRQFTSIKSPYSNKIDLFQIQAKQHICMNIHPAGVIMHYHWQYGFF